MRFESQKDYYEIELARLRKEKEIKISDLDRKINVLNEKINELNFIKVNLEEENTMLKIESEESKATATSLQNEKEILETGYQQSMEQNILLNTQLTELENDLTAKSEELEKSQDRIRELQQNMTALIERASDNLSDLPDTTESNPIIHIDPNEDASVESLECKICCERNKQKSCLPVSKALIVFSLILLWKGTITKYGLVWSHIMLVLC